MAKVHLVLGDAGVGKTTYALSGEDPVDYFETDPGSIERAMAGTNIDPARVRIHQYSPPLSSLTIPVGLDTKNLKAPVSIHHLKGWTEVFWHLVQDYLEALNGDGYPVFDTETKLWLMTRQTFMQELQDATGQERDRLAPLQYTEPNARYDQIISAAKAKGKDLILIAHEKEIWENDRATGRYRHDGKAEAANLADVVLRFIIRNKKPVAIVQKAGAGGLELIGREIQEPTIGKVNAILDSAAKLRRSGFELPDTNEQLVELAGSL